MDMMVKSALWLVLCGSAAFAAVPTSSTNNSASDSALVTPPTNNSHQPPATVGLGVDASKAPMNPGGDLDDEAKSDPKADPKSDPAPAEAKEADEPLAAQYGFLPPEIYKIDPRLKNLIVRDINKDGKLDIAVVNNLHNRIDVLEQRPDGDDSDKPVPIDTNEIVNDWRMRHRKIPVPRTIYSIDFKDVNNDGRADMIYLGDPAGLYVQYQDENGNFTQTRTFEIPDASQQTWALDVDDLNGDGRLDVTFLGRENLYVAYQDEEGRLKAPVAFRLTDGTSSLIRILDLNGDGRKDIVYLTDDEQFPVRVRFQSAEHKLGPEKRLEIEPPRGVSYIDFDAKPGPEMLTISNRSDRLQVYGLTSGKIEYDAPTSQVVVYPFRRIGGNSRVDLTVADFDGDKKVDVVVSDNNASHLFLYLQDKNEGLDLGDEFPAMLGTTILRSADFNGDGKAELLSLSERESSIGLSRFADNRLTFPQLIPTKDEPMVMEVIGEGKDARLYYVAHVKTDDPKITDPKEKSWYELRSLRAQSDAEGEITWEPADLGKAKEMRLDLENNRPNDLRQVDVNGDGRPDLMVFFIFQPPVILLGQEDGSFAETPKTSRGTLGTVSPPAVYSGPLNGKPAFLVAQSNFARNMLLDDQGKWKVSDQYNASDSSGKITGISVIDLLGDGEGEIAMYDRAASSIQFLKMSDGLYRPWKKLKVGAFALGGIRVADFNSDGKQDLLLFDSEKMGIAYAGTEDVILKQLASYESDIRKGKLFDMIAGDLNSDGKNDILVLEPIRHNLEILAITPDHQLKRAQRWQVFEEKSFQRESNSLEPREVMIGDVDGDGRNDIIMLVHDRILVYPQDPGTAPAKEDKPTASPEKAKAPQADDGDADS